MEKNDVVKSVQANGTFDFQGKTFYKYEVEMENGDVGEYNSISANQSNFVEGVQVDYIYDTSKPKFPKIKPVYNFKASPARDGNYQNIQKAQRGDDVQKMIVKQSCLKAAVECVQRDDADAILRLADVFVDWVMNTENLISVQSYAHAQNVSVTSVYRWIKDNVVKAVEIDGVKFIITKSPRKN